MSGSGDAAGIADASVARARGRVKAIPRSILRMA
jgi:hypothetical protein